MTNDFAIPCWRVFPAAAIVLFAWLLDGPCEPPFVRADLVIRHGGKSRGEQIHDPANRRPTLTINRRNRRPVNLGIRFNGDIDQGAARRNVEVAILGPSGNRRAKFRYFFLNDNISGDILGGRFSGFVDPGFNFGDLTVQAVPKKRKSRRNGRIAGVTIRAFDRDLGRTVDSVRAVLRKR